MFVQPRTQALSSRGALTRKNPGRSWSREPPDSGGKLKLFSRRGGRGTRLFHLKLFIIFCYEFVREYVNFTSISQV